MSSLTHAKHRFDPVLAAIVLLAAIGGAVMVGKASFWAVMPDELIYTEMGRSIADTIIPLPGLQGRWATIYQVVFPTLISPLVGGLPMTDAYSLIAVLNAILMASAAIPAYLLASWATESRTAARWVALCSVVTPWLIFASKALPDAAAYAAATWAFYAIARSAGDPERALKRDLLALAAILIAFLTRSQFLLLFAVWLGVVVTAQIAQGLASGGWRQGGRALLRVPIDRPTPTLVFLLVVVLVKFKPLWIVGAYISVTKAGGETLASGSLLTELMNHLSVVGLGLAALPVVLGLPWLLTALTRVREPRQIVTASLIALASAVVIYIAANFDLRFEPSERVIERYIFYVAPLWFVAMAAFFRTPPKNLVAFALPAFIATLVVVASDPYGLDNALNRAVNRTFSPTQVVLIGWQNVADVIGFSISMLVVTLMLLLCVLSWWLISNKRADLAQNISFALVAAVLLSGTLTLVPGAVSAQNEAPEEILGERTDSQKRWIEIATKNQPWAISYAPRALVFSLAGGAPVENRGPWRNIVFWNRGLTTVYNPYRDVSVKRTAIPGSEFPLIPEWSTGRVQRTASDDADFLVMSSADSRFAPETQAPPIRRDGFALYAVGKQFYAAWAIRGLTASGFVPPSNADLRVWAPRGEATQETEMRIALTIGATKADRELEGFKIVGGEDVQRRRKGLSTTFTWTQKIPAGSYADFELVRGMGPAHVNRVNVSAQRQG